MATIHPHTSSNTDEYKAPVDRIWSDVIKHERLLEVKWKETWENTLPSKELCIGESIKAKTPVTQRTSFYSPKPSPPVPLKASAMVGWRSTDLKNSMEYFNVRYKSNKKRFVKEQFGHYRALKYYQEEEKTQLENEIRPYESNVKHIPKRLVC